MGAESYAGVPFFDSSLNVMGHLVVFDRRPMLDKERTISILRVFASRAGAELERQRAEETIKNIAYYDSSHRIAQSSAVDGPIDSGAGSCPTD